jgi:hypothetical protein
MKKADLHPELKGFFDKHRTHTKAHKRAMHDQLTPIAQVCAEVRKHIIDLQTQLQTAELAAHDGKLDNKMTFMHTRLVALERCANQFFAAGRDLANCLTEVDAGFAQDTLDAVATLTASFDPPEAPTTNG